MAKHERESYGRVRSASTASRRRRSRVRKAIVTKLDPVISTVAEVSREAGRRARPVLRKVGAEVSRRSGQLARKAEREVRRIPWYAVCGSFVLNVVTLLAFWRAKTRTPDTWFNRGKAMASSMVGRVSDRVTDTIDDVRHKAADFKSEIGGRDYAMMGVGAVGLFLLGRMLRRKK